MVDFRRGEVRTKILGPHISEAAQMYSCVCPTALSCIFYRTYYTTYLYLLIILVDLVLCIFVS